MSLAPGKADEQFAAERLATNLSRLWVAAWLGFIAHAIHVAVFFTSRPPSESDVVAAWRTQVISAHAVMMGVTLLAGAASRSGGRFPGLARLAPGLVTLAYLLLGAVLTGVDQAVTTDTSPWLLVVLAMVMLLRLDGATTLATLVLSSGVYFGGQWLMQHDTHVLLSNSVKGLSAAVVGMVLATTFNRSQRREFDQRRLIEQQRAELEAALTDARQAAAAAERANRAKTQFLATMSHEIRTPMTGVLGVAELLAHTSLDSQQRELLQVVQESGSTLVALISDLLDLSKSEGGHLELESIPLDVEREVAAVARLFEPRARTKGLQLTARWSGETPPLLKGDPLRLRQVLSNLVGNAIKFTVLGGVELQCRAETRGERCALWLDVVDTGPGISPEVLARVFKPWMQADETTARTHGGTGLGLAISQQLVEAMSGRLEATSVVGRGSTFGLALELPCATGTELDAVAVEPRSTTRGAPLVGRVLVADDSSVNQLVARGILRQLGLEVEVAADGAGAEALLAEHTFDAVVTDLHMPGIGGLELLRWVRSREGALKHLPVVVLTADLSPAERASCLAEGANAVLSKPFRSAEIEACLRAQVPSLTH
jgi:signal transduction histidine kinase/ActR/RegA family two-component response regulator